MNSLGRAMSQRFINVCDNQLFNPAVPTRPVHSVKGAMMMIRRKRAIGLQFILSLYQLCRGSAAGLKVLLFAIKSLWSRRSELYKVRKYIQSSRKVSDKDLFKKVLIKPGLRYYFHFYKGDLPRYWESRK